MITVSVKLFLTLREIVGKKAIELNLPEHSTVLDLINFMTKKYGGAFSRCIFDEENKVREYLNFMINGKNVMYLNGFETTLNNGDSIVIIPPVAGG